MIVRKTKTLLTALATISSATLGLFAAEDVSPVWSEDGKTIYFYSYRGKPAQLYKMNIDGSHQTELTDTEFHNWWMLPVSGTHGTEFVVASDKRGKERFKVANLYHFNLKDQSYKRLTDASVAGNEWAIGASLTADGRYMLYRFARGGFRSADSDVYLLDRTEQTSKRLLTNYTDVRLAKISPDGNTIIFQSQTKGPNILHVADGQGKNARAVINMGAAETGKFAGLSFSPDGKQIVFSYTPGAYQDADLYKANIDGTALTQLTHAAGLDNSPSWSPDGSMIAFESSRDGGKSEIYLMQSDGSHQRNLTQNSNKSE